MPMQGNGHTSSESPDRLGNWVARLEEMEQECNRRIEAYMEHVLEVELVIQMVKNGTQRTILRMRYLDGLLWEEISERTHYTDRWCRVLHDRGLEDLGLRKDRSKSDPCYSG